METPFLSVIVPVYKSEQYIEDCARSLFGQTFADIEYIFIDDCSPDGSMDVLQRVLGDYPERRSGVRVFRMDVNSGQAAVRTKGLELARGKYVTHCDSDDTVEPRAYSLLCAKALEEDLDIVSCDLLCEKDGRWKRVSGASPTGCEVSSLLYCSSPWNLVNRIIRRSLLEDLVPPAGNMGEDMVITVQATLKARSFGYVREPLYKYWFRASSYSKSPGEDVSYARWKALYSNVSLIVDLLCSRYGYSGREPELIAFKYYGRHCLEPLVHIPRYYRIWRDTYPEVDPLLLRTPGVSPQTKFWYVLMRLRLYHFVKRITGLFR